jgi:hypothetical protein
MFPIIRLRREARALSRKLRKSLAAPEDNWKVDTDEEGRPTLFNGNIRIVLVPRAARIFDAIHVYSNDAEIWLPLLPRLRLRGSARLRLIEDATDHWQDLNQKKPRGRRRHAKPAA